MDQERWQRVEKLFEEAVACPEPQRAALLDAACRDDDALRREVEELLESAARTGDGFLPTSGGRPWLPRLGRQTAPLTGKSIVPYVVGGLLGAGGMGEVYRARDTKLRRDVAIKVLPAVFSQDSDRLARFDREARVLASLNHPHIGAIYGLEEVDDIRALVLELVEGQTLAQHLATRVTVDGALAIARQIADALDAAHARGIVHRDLKPANITITPAGVVKVLDFGLAKLMGPDAPAPDTSETRTASPAATVQGTVLGTPAYMSPEQARGLPVDARTDIWAFGCVLFEMLAGRRAFDGATASDTIAAVLERQPDWSLVPASTPESVKRLLTRCLAKDLRHRLRDIGDARLELDDDGAEVPVGAVPSRSAASRLGWVAGGVGAFALGAVATFVTLRPAPTTDATHRTAFVIPPPEGVIWGQTPVDPNPSVSPDGQWVASIASKGGVRRLWLHNLRSGSDSAIEGTGDASRAAWAPDSRSLAYCADEKIKIVDLAGRAPRIVNAPTCWLGLSWGASDEFLFGTLRGVMRLPQTGGAASAVTHPEADDTHLYPQWIGGGPRFVYLSRSQSPERRGIFLASVAQGTSPTRLVPDETAPIVVARGDGHATLIFVRGAALVSQPFDVSSGALEGDATVLGEQVAIGQTVRNGAYAAAGRVLAFRSGAGYPRSQLVWVDRLGRRLRAIDGVNAHGNISLSADGSTLASERYNVDRNVMEVWLTELERGVSRLLLGKPYGTNTPIFSPDGQRLAFLSAESGLYVPFETTLRGEIRPLFSGAGPVPNLSDWSQDGRWVIGAQNNHVVALPAEGGQAPLVLAPGAEGRLSPDGQWLAFRSSESGAQEIYVQRFPDGTQKARVSDRGGFKPSWRADGRELFYRTAEGDLVAVDVRPGPALTIGQPHVLFNARFVPGITSIPIWDYVVMKDGQRFLIELSADTVAPPLSVILDWSAPPDARRPDGVAR